MDVVYVVPSDFPEMPQNPGEYLAAELDRIGMTRQQLARLCDVNWPTADRWTKNEGFSKKNRQAAARAMGLQEDHFERPDYSALHHALRMETIAKFLADPLAPPDVTEEEKAALRSQQMPLTRKPTIHFYMALLSLLRGHLEPSDFAAELAENEKLAASVVRKAVKSGEIAADKKPQGKKKATKKVARKPKGHR